MRFLFAGRNFALGYFLDINTQKRPMYYLTRDGFAEVAMSYGGLKAMKLRMRFLASFAELEAAAPQQNKLHEPCVPVRWLAQQLGRSRSSVDRTINVSIKRLREYAVSTEVQYVNGERCLSPALIICCMFTGTKMQAARGWLLTLAETDKLPAPEVLLQLTSPLT